MTKVKICGITNLEDAGVAVEVGADLLGFIFYKPSPRYVAPEVVREIVLSFKGQVTDSRGAGGQGSLREPNTQPVTRNEPLFVGVFVNTPLPDVEQILNFCDLDAAQLHGEESPEFVAHFQGRAYKALRPKSRDEAKGLVKKYANLPFSIPNKVRETNYKIPIAQSPNPSTKRLSSLSRGRTSLPSSQSLLPCLLLDAYHPSLYGGTGRVTDWSMAANIARQHSIMLAGSLTPENVAEAVKAVRPWGVDVSSGVEAEKGRKDHKKVRAFIEVVKNVKRIV